MPIRSRVAAIAAIAAVVACTQQADPQDADPAPTPDPAMVEPAPPPVQTEGESVPRPVTRPHRRDHDDVGVHVVRLTEGVFWIGPSVLTDLVAEVAQRELEGKPHGDDWQVTHVESGSTAARLGLMPGDSIRRVAGKSPSDPEMFEVVHRTAHVRDPIDVELVRDGKPVFVRYHLEPVGEVPLTRLVSEQFFAVLGGGVRQYGPAKRVIDRLVLKTLKEEGAVLSSSGAVPLNDILGLAGNAEIMSVGPKTVDHPRVAWIALGELAGESAFTITYDVDGKSGLLEVEVTEGTLSEQDLQAARDKLGAGAYGRGSGGGSTERSTPTLEGIEMTGEDTYEIRRSTVDDWLANPATLARSARVVPSMTDGKTDGFKLYAIRPGSIYAVLGLKNGDKITAVNGMDVSTADKALTVYTKMRSADEVVLDVVRRGKPLKLTYRIK